MEAVKAQLRIERDFYEEDDLLEMYAASAEETILSLCGRTYEEFFERWGCIPVAVVHASLLLVDISYKHRSPADPQHLSAIPYGNIDILIKPYVKLAG